ncbi:MAG: adenylyl-sulfate kinase [Verrucomicrobiota bacterium]
MAETESNLSIGQVRLLGRSARERLTGQRSLTIWMFGLSGSGKSTLATALDRTLNAEGRLTTLLDGDLLRTGLNAGLGFSDDDRRENVRRAAEVARLFNQAGVISICSFITPRKALRTIARQIVGEDDFLLVYVKASMDTCRARDVKGLYAKADGGALKQFTGRDSVFEEPVSVDLTLDTETMSEEACMAALLAAVRPRLVRE